MQHGYDKKKDTKDHRCSRWIVEEYPADFKGNKRKADDATQRLAHGMNWITAFAARPRKTVESLLLHTPFRT